MSRGVTSDGVIIYICLVGANGLKVPGLYLFVISFFFSIYVSLSPYDLILIPS